MSGVQATFDVDGRSDAQTLTDSYRLDLAEQAKATGQRRAVERDPHGFERASDAISALPRLRQPFDADDVRVWAGPFQSVNVLGAAFSAAKKRDLIRTAGVTTAKAVSRHGGLVRLWEGVP
jgi:hypothetical protein